MNLTEAALFAPSIRQLVDTMSDVLLDRRHILVVVVPAGVMPMDVWDLLRLELGRRDADVRDLSLGYGVDTPTAALAFALGVLQDTTQGCQSIESILSQTTQGMQFPDVLYLDQFDQLASAERASWYTFLERWGAIMRQRVNQGQSAIALCAIIGAATWNDTLHHYAPVLDVMWWWGAPSVVETRLLCRAQKLSIDCREAWREHVLPPVAGGDIALLFFLWDHIFDNWQELVVHLRNYADQREWDLAKLKAWGAERACAYLNQHRNTTLSQPAPDIQVLWAQGALQHTAEHGVELNIAALAYLGRDDLIRYRLWRGQVQYVFTLVNSLRLAACDYLAHIYGTNWPTRVQSPSDDKIYQQLIKDPHSCEFDHLRTVFASRSMKETKWDRWKPLIERARIIRNDIAHYNPISYAAFEELWNLQTHIMRA